ncbi:3-methyladenine DNA glycosylase [Helicobacter sp.]|uniref:3-methyladenine DNA glycosylase n=1 Tax=Helicobacter sp. TaxID=218 RepID=UPI0019B7EFD3|nr:3-methyladenine DNA glycosylase [Helicobacter sp.]MBD5165328.1 3-methyladenine DNA glycosylase [Helicobacter sp.]
MRIASSYELLEHLKSQNLLPNMDKNISAAELESLKEIWWWPNALSFEVIIGAILVQNTRWEQVFVALERLKVKGLLDLEVLSEVSLTLLQDSIQNIGFYRQKAVRIQRICQNILKDFGDYASFCAQVSRQWLLSQKGIGLETCDAILCYALGREVMVADHYTYKLLQTYGYTLESYEGLQDWLQGGVIENYDKVCALYGFKIPINLLFARFHGKIVEYCKNHKI